MYSPTGQKLGAYKLNPAINGNFEPFMIVALVSSDQFFGSRRLAVMDQLGSVGMYYPWGENRGGTNPQDTWSFGTYWTDSVTGLDYANNRYYFNSLGRFMTPDPYQGDSGPGDTDNPQSWNRYAYVVGDPINWIDPSGQFYQPPPPIPDQGPPPFVNPTGPGGASPQEQKGERAARRPCPAGTYPSTPAGPPCTTTNQSLANYGRYVWCVVTALFGAQLANPDLSFGLSSVAAVAIKFGYLALGGTAALIELSYLASLEPEIARQCAILENYQPWFLQNQ
jgi:RHS repeat-associated protein